MPNSFVMIGLTSTSSGALRIFTDSHEWASRPQPLQSYYGSDRVNHLSYHDASAELVRRQERRS
jgi:hypothetical protein